MYSYWHELNQCVPSHSGRRVGDSVRSAGECVLVSEACRTGLTQTWESEFSRHPRVTRRAALATDASFFRLPDRASGGPTALLTNGLAEMARAFISRSCASHSRRTGSPIADGWCRIRDLPAGPAQLLPTFEGPTIPRYSATGTRGRCRGVSNQHSHPGRRVESNCRRLTSREQGWRYFLKTFAKMGPASASSMTGRVWISKTSAQTAADS